MAAKACAIAFALLVALGVPRAHAQCTAPSEGLVGHWTLDETSGTTAVATVGSNGTMLGGLSATNDSVAGQVGTALDLDSNDYISVADNASLEASNSMTVSAWFKVPSVGVQRKILYKDNSVSPWVGWELYVTASNEVSFQMANTAAGYFSVGSNAIVNAGEWYHAVGVNNNGVLSLYVNGKEVEEFWNSGPFTGTYLNSDESLHFGTSGASAFLTGVVDDVRMYNRALSAAEIAALYAVRSTADAPAGFMTYDARSAAMIYCDGTDWVHAGIGSYNPNGVEFDGTNDYLDLQNYLADPTGRTTVTGSFWVSRKASGLGINQPLLTDSDSAANDYFRFRFNTGNGFTIDGNDGGGQAAFLNNSSTVLDDGWHHIMFSLDVTDRSKDRLYIDGVNVANSTANTDTHVRGGAQTEIGSEFGGGDRFHGQIADFWIDYGTYIDLSLEANRNKFLSPSGMPMYLGADGSIPTGAAPDIFLSGDTANWHTNKGVIGAFTENGALTTAGSQPGENIVNAGADITSNLLGYWPLNEGSGTSTADTSGNGANGTLMDNTAWQGTGYYGPGLAFDGTGDYVNIPGTMNLGTQVTITGWFKTDTITSNQTIFAVFDDSNDPNYYGLILNQDWCTPMCLAGQTDVSPSWTLFAIDSTTNIVAGQWYFGAFTVNGNDLKIYLNGVLEKSITVGANAAFSGTPEIGRSDINWNWQYFDGALDDIRVYNRVLSDNDIKLLYACGVPQGTMKYDPNSSVMQYCNGAEWVPMGPVGGAPPAGGLVAHWKMDETSGATAVDSAGSFDLTLNNMSPPANWTAGKIDNALDLDGVDDEGVALGLTGQPQNLTAAAWVNLDSTPDASGAEVLSIADYVGVRLDANGTESFGYYYTGTGWNNTWANIIFIGKGWRHIAYVFDDINDIQKLYIDGVEVGSTNYTESISYSGLGSNTLIGRNGNGGGFPYDGRIDDLRLYNRALGPQEISQIYNFGRSGGLGDVDNACASPSADEGEMIYNATHGYMQYCNGERWVAIGK